ncbi:MAG: DUF1499 domain-containing protein [Gammaproteobacteria bacterium]
MLLYTAGVVLVLAALAVGTMLFNRAPLWKPPGPWARITAYLTTNVAETSDHAARPELRTPRYAVDGAILFRCVGDAVVQLGWRLEDRNPRAGTLAAVVRTPLWHFRDDVTVTILAPPDGGSALHVRSASRVGRGDLAANTRHVLDLLDAVRECLAAPGAGR